MTLTWIALLSVPLAPAAAENAIGVCEALANRLELNKTKVTVRGVFSTGHRPGELQSIMPCEHPTVSDGWLFADTIEAVPETWPQSSPAEAEYYRLLKSHTVPVKIVATLTGRLETRSYFKTFKDAFGEEVTNSFNRAAVRLIFRTAKDLEAVPYSPGELSAQFQELRQRWPKRLK